jgi:hypothetical protein
MTGSPGTPPGGTDYRVQYQSELPEVMGRKLGLMDIGVQLGKGPDVDPANYPSWLAPQALPQQKIAGYDPTQEQAFLESGIPRGFRGAAQAAAAQPGGIGGYEQYLTKAQDYMGPDAYKDFLNPYQDYVTKGIEEQFGKARTAAEAQGVQTGAFGGARQGLQMAELTRQQAEAVGASKAAGYGQAQQLAGQAAQQQLGLAGQSQQMAMGDISTLMQMGGQEQQLQQQVYDEQYRRSIQEQYEPYQRLGFVSDIMQGAPTSASSLAMATTPQANPLAQAVGAGISGLALYQGYQDLTN